MLIMMLLAKARNEAMFAHCAAGTHLCRRQHHKAKPTSLARKGKHHIKKCTPRSAFYNQPRL